VNVFELMFVVFLRRVRYRDTLSMVSAFRIFPFFLLRWIISEGGNRNNYLMKLLFGTIFGFNPRRIFPSARISGGKNNN
jgi:hypothetical protein